jgi:hypothetical protein
MKNKGDSLEWLRRQMESYRSMQNDIGEVVEDFDNMGKLGRGFTSIDELEEVNIGNGIDRRPTYMSSGLIDE